MIRKTRIKAAATVALTTLLVIAGCSSLPTAPGSERASDGASVQPKATTGPSAAILATSTTTINGKLGGRVTAGNFTVMIPPLAITGTATVTVTQPDVARPFVNLDISPASANRFRMPVTVIADATPMDSRQLSLAYISWYDPAAGRWIRTPYSVASLTRRTVQAPLWHFSQYRVESGGKAGW